MTKKTKSVLNKVVSALTKPSSSSKPRNRRRRRPQNNRRRPRMRRPRVSRRFLYQGRAALPAAYSQHVRSRFRSWSWGQNSVMVSGCDLVESIPVYVTNDSDYLFAIIPANPAYWKGTRIGQIAPTYMNYRPLRISFSYVPQVSVTTPGTVVMGTLWNGTTIPEDIQQALTTSNGGLLTTCYTPADTSVNLGSHLPYNLFRMDGQLQDTTNPFVFVAAFRGAGVIPGYFYVTYTYEFKNPIGAAIDYGIVRSQTDFPSNVPRRHNVSAINRSSFTTSGTTYGPGTVFDVEWTSATVDKKTTWTPTIFYRGSRITVDDDSSMFDYFWNGPLIPEDSGN